MCQNRSNPHLERAILTGINSEYLHILGENPRKYTSYDDSLDIMSHPRAYLGEPEIFAAQNRYNVPINTSLSSNDLPNPTNADPSAIQLLYNASSRHYCCCLLTSLPPNNLPPFVVTGIATAMASRRHQLPSPAGIPLHCRLQKCRTSRTHTPDNSPTTIFQPLLHRH